MNKSHHGVFATSATMERTGNSESGSVASSPGSNFPQLNDLEQVTTSKFQISYS